MNYLKHYFFDIIHTKYSKFRGRASRKEFWNFILLATLFGIFVLVLGENLKQYFIMLPKLYTFITALQILLWISILLPLISVGSRRLHDIGKSAWWYIIVAVPGIGLIVLLILFMLPSEDRINRYGHVHHQPYHSIYNILKSA